MVSNFVIVEKLNNNIPDPCYAHKGDAGIDCYAACDCIIEPYSVEKVPLGIKIQMQVNKAAFVLPRSGLSSKIGLNAVTGLIDNGYRGEISMIAQNVSDKKIKISEGDKICQLMIVDAPQADIVYGKVVDDTDRGESGFGSTGV